MKRYLLLSLLLFTTLSVQAQRRLQRLETYEVNSPSVWAKNFDVSYGMKPSILDGLAELYQKDGLDSLARRRKVEKLIRDFRVVAPKDAPKEQKKLELSPAERQQLGIAERPEVAEALEFQLYTQGANSPAVYALGDVKIWYGIPKKAFLGIVAVLEEKQAQVEDFGAKLAESVKNYEDLKAELATYGPTNPTIKKAEQLLDEGKLLEVEKLLKTDFFLRQKGLAYEGYILGKTEALLLKYDSAAYFYLAAVQNDPNNSRYLLAYANTENTRAHYDEAITYYQKALAIDTVTFKDQPEKAAVLYNNLGSAWDSKGEYDRAIALYEKALSIDSIAFGSKHPNVAVQYNNLGEAWRQKGKYDRAIALFEKALAIDSIAFGSKHPDVAIDYNNLGSAWKDKGNYDRAITLYEKAQSILIQAFGDKHPNVAICYNNLGVAYRKKGKYDLAIALYEKALAIDSVAFGIQHPNVATCYSNLGSVWSEKGEYNRAITLLEKALAIDSVAFRSQHPNVAIRYNNLGEVYRKNGNHDRAIVFYQKALPIFIQTFGDKHPNMAVYYNNLGLAWKAKSEYDRAIALYEKALAIDSLAFGSQHPNVATCYNNLGSAWKAKSEYDRAIALYEKALAIDSVAFGSQHPDVAIDYHNLGSSWYAKGDYDRAFALSERALSIFIQFLGKRHPNTQTVAQNLSRAANDRGMQLFQQGQYATALPYFQKALSNAEAAEDWAFSLTCLSNTGSTYKRLGQYAEGQYAEGLAALDQGLARAAELNQRIDAELKTLPAETLQQPKVQAKIAELKNLTLLRRMRYHRLGCLAGLGRKKEAQVEATALYRECVEAKDERTAEDLKKDGWVKE